MSQGNKNPVRVLNVISEMNRGGIETWLMHVLRNIDRERFQIDFLVYTTQACAYDAEIRALGSRIIACPRPDTRRPWRYAFDLRRRLRQHDSYDVIHSHTDHFSGYTLWLARQDGIPARIAHSHTASFAADTAKGHWRRMYLQLMKHQIDRHATLGLAVSHKAALSLFGPAWEDEPRWHILHYGIDLAPFREPLEPTSVRAELGIPADAFVIGHVGRFVTPKNHTFLVDIVREVVRREPQTCLLLVGDGELRPAIEQHVTRNGLESRVIFAGVRPDVHRLMRGAIDVLLMPSLYEGLPVVGIEAQAAGVPLVLSDVITEELDQVAPLLTRCALAQPPAAWAEAVLKARKARPGIAQPEALAIIERGSFNIANCVHSLEQWYADT